MEKVFCCESMKENTLLQQPNDDVAFASSDKLIYYNEIFGEYGLIVHDGGQSYIIVNFCPWCGKKLPISERDNWFLALEKLGYDSPFEEEIPEQFKSSDWRKR